MIIALHRERCIMKVHSSKLAVATAILTIFFSATSRSEEAGRTEGPKSSLQAKIEYCTMCHGSSGQGYRGFFPMPRLAGQQPEYFENQLRAFAERRRENRYMSSVARTLSPSMRTALANHFMHLNPRPLNGAPRQLVSTGKKIFEEGDPNTNVPACMACHGEEAKGQRETPRLAGQLNDYIVSKLVNWKKERGQDAAKPDISAVMLPTSHNLTKAQIAAVAAYVSYLQ